MSFLLHHSILALPAPETSTVNAKGTETRKRRTFAEHQHLAKHEVGKFPLSSHFITMTLGSWLPSPYFYRWRNWSSEKMSKLPRVIRTTECSGLQPKSACSPIVLCPVPFVFSAPRLILGLPLSNSVSEELPSQKP